jgi:hypothetical protein
MKTKLFLSVLLSFVFGLISSQVPQGFNYQAIARDGSTPITTTLPVRITIQSESTGGTEFWVEEHSSVTPNESGLFTIVIGNGTRISGLASFSDIDWTVSPKYIKTEINYGGWKKMGTTQLWTVPYSMVAKDLEGPVEKLGVKGTTIDVEEPLFEVKNKDGQTIFAVYNEGVRIYVEDGAKGSKGGFSIGGFGDAKAHSQEYLRVTRDSARLYVNDAVKGAKGGFSIGGFGTAKAGTGNFLDLTKDNYFIGQGSGSKITSGLYNSFFGYLAGSSTTSGSKNAFIGNLSGQLNTTGYSNVFIGDQAGAANINGFKNVIIGNEAGFNSASGDNNVYIGFQAGYSSTYGDQNICIGNYSGYSNITGQNLFIGEYAGEKNTSGTRNSFVGFFAGQNNVIGNQNSYFGQFAGTDNTGSYNTMIGYWSGGNNVNGSNNAFLGYRSGQGNDGSNSVFLGYQAGEGNTGSNNVLIGYQAGSYSGNKSNVLYIDNSNTSSPLIGGDFSGNRVGINRMPTTYTLEVGGTIWANGSSIVANQTTWSDVRYKTDIEPFMGALADIMKMQGVRYTWRQNEFPDLNFPEGGQIGVIAQDLEKILPELVFTGPDGYKSVSYEKLTPVLIEAIKEQQSQIESLKERLEQIEAILVQGTVVK